MVRIRDYLELVRFSHTLFALPFALYSAVLAAGGWPSAATLTKIVIAMVGARSAAMAHNRLADRRIDAANPRTASRALPAGALSVGFVRTFLVVAVAVFLAAAASLNRLTLLLSPLFYALVELAAPFRILITVAALAPLGLALGMPMPTGIRLLGARAPELVPWAWGVNGAASVLGSVAAVALAMLWGFDRTLLLAAALYVAAAFLAARALTAGSPGGAKA